MGCVGVLCCDDTALCAGSVGVVTFVVVIGFVGWIGLEMEVVGAEGVDVEIWIGLCWGWLVW